MSKRLTNVDSKASARFHQKSSHLRPGYTGKLPPRETVRQTFNEIPQISHTARRNAYDKIKKIQAIERQKGSQLSYQELLRDVKNVVKDDIEITSVGIFPGEAKNQIGRAILSDGTFFVVFAKIIFRCQYIVKKSYLASLRKKFLPNVTENRSSLVYFLEDEEERADKMEREKKETWITKETERIQEKYKNYSKPAEIHQFQEKIQPKKLQQAEKVVDQVVDQRTFREFATMTSQQKEQSQQMQKIIRKSCIKPSLKQQSQSERKNVRWSQIQDCSDSSYLNQIVQANKEYANQQKIENQKKEMKQKIERIRKSQSFLIDFFEINDIFDMSMVDVIGVMEEIDNKYAIILIREKPQSPSQSYVKIRNSKIQDSSRKKEEKEKREMLAIGLMRKMNVHQHKVNQLKEIERNHPDIAAYVEIDDPDTLFLGSLPDESVSNEIKKK